MSFLLFLFAPLLHAQPLDLTQPIIAPQDHGFILEQPALDFWTKRIPFSELTPHKELGFSHVSNMNVRSIAVGKKRLIWDVVYRFDKYGRRITAVEPQAPVRQAIIFSGCSFTFGTGLPEGETIPDLIAKALPQVRVYNTAIGASGTNQTLTLLKMKTFEEMFPEQESLFVYVYLKDHVMRSNAIYPAVGWMKKTPHFEWEGKKLVSHGMIEDQKKWRTLFYEKVGELFYRGSYFPELSDEHYEYSCDLVAEARRHHEGRGPGHRFVVIEHPLAVDDRFAECLQKRKIPLLRYSHSLSEDDIIRGEAHPSASFNRVWAQKLLPDLALTGR